MVAALAVTAFSSAQVNFSHPDRIRYDGQCFTIEGKDTFLYSGAFHYFRCPKPLWRARFKKIKEAGFNAVETYVPWNWHEKNQPKGLDDFSQIDLKDLEDWLNMAEKEFGLYTIIRPGPYICAEWASGGYPQWLMNFKPEKPKLPQLWVRTDDPVYQAWSKHWFDAVCKVVAPHQITRRKPGEKGVIMFQLENEYDFAGLPADIMSNHVRALAKYSWDGGIDVPLFTCWTRPVRGSTDPILSQIFDCPNLYPRWDINSVIWAGDNQHKNQENKPKMVTEFQGGWFGQVGGLASEEQDGIDDAQINALTINAIAHGFTGLNYYMLFGGTNFGDWAGQGITTSYDYFSPIREWGGGGAKFEAVKSIGQFLNQFGGDIARSKASTETYSTDNANVEVLVREGASGGRYIFIHNKDRKSPAQVSITGPNVAISNVTLSPFGSTILRLEGAKPTFLGNYASKLNSQGALPRFTIREAEAVALQPKGWLPVKSESTVQALGVFDSRPIAYRVASSSTPSAANLLVRVNNGDITAWSNGKFLEASQVSRRGSVYKTPDLTKASLIYFNPGWPNGGSGMEAKHGLVNVGAQSKIAGSVELQGWEVRSDFNLTDPNQLGGEISSGLWNHTNILEVPQRQSRMFRTSFNLPKSGAWRLEIGSIDDEGWIFLNGQKIGESHKWDEPVSLELGGAALAGKNELVIVVRNGEGDGGIDEDAKVEIATEMKIPPVGLEWTDKFVDSGSRSRYLLTTSELPRLIRPNVRNLAAQAMGPLIKSTIRFDVEKLNDYAWEMILDAGGDGFLKLNGHDLGRFWQVGPQRAFYLPECWLKSKGNVLEYVARPDGNGDRITGAQLYALPK